MSQIIIRLTEVEPIIDLRWRILRAGLERASARFEGDSEPATHHLIALENDRIVGCATILQRPWENSPAWQLRGMAVEPATQRRGIGRLLVERAEQIVGASPYSRQFWCNARVPAAGFYQRLGWMIASEPFDIPTAGPHVRMQKRLNS
jgi:GNAT superfamily N-acetyltransferase